MVEVIVAVPMKLVAGVNSKLVPTMLTVPLVVTASVRVNRSPFTSESLASGAIVTGVFSGVVAVSSLATGASFIGVTVTVLGPDASQACPSLTVCATVGEPVPIKVEIGRALGRTRVKVSVV